MCKGNVGESLQRHFKLQSVLLEDKRRLRHAALLSLALRAALKQLLCSCVTGPSLDYRRFSLARITQLYRKQLKFQNVSAFR